MQNSRTKLVVGNWKMNGSFVANNQLVQGLLQDLPHVAVGIAPPTLYLTSVASQIRGRGLQLVAQNVAAEAQHGAYTGEVSARMLAEAGVDMVIVGHSERRQYYAETDAMVVQKVLRLLEQGLTPIICVGETLTERESGQAEAVVSRQVQAVIDGCGLTALANSVIAYEPIWAIGTGKTATPQDAQAIHAIIRQQIARHDEVVANSLRLLYGGSVKADNAAALFAMPDIDGGLVGGASLQAQDFLAICRAASV